MLTNDFLIVCASVIEYRVDLSLLTDQEWSVYIEAVNSFWRTFVFQGKMTIGVFLYWQDEFEHTFGEVSDVMLQLAYDEAKKVSIDP